MFFTAESCKVELYKCPVIGCGTYLWSEAGWIQHMNTAHATATLADLPGSEELIKELERICTI